MAPILSRATTGGNALFVAPCPMLPTTRILISPSLLRLGVRASSDL